MSLQTTNLQTMDFYSFVLKAFLVLALFATPAHAFPARIVGVVDGDTIDVEADIGGQRVRVRLYGIDAPEKRQPGGETAKSFVFSFLFQAVNVEPQGKTPDKYGRIVAIVYLSGSESLQVALLQAGFAWVWPRYCRNCSEWQSLQDAARMAGRGIWADSEPVPPWVWRRQ